jgi:hypothetical protein
MLYTEARPLIQSFDLIAFRGTGLIGNVIRSVTRGDYSHVGLAWRVGGRLLMMELKEGVGSRIVPLSNRGPFDWISTRIGDDEELLSFALQNMGNTRYSYLNAFMAGLGIDSIFPGEQCAMFVESVYLRHGLLTSSLPDKPSLLVERVREALGPHQSALIRP